jgi:hypothetical protein
MSSAFSHDGSANESSSWDEQLDRDSSSGKLDVLFEEADEESESGLLHDWPPMK